MRIERSDKTNLAEVVALLQGGGVIIYPTETVYGLGCLAHNGEGIDRIALMKGSNAEATYLILIRDSAEIENYATRIPPAARELANHFWPGPLTMVLPASPHLHWRLIGPTNGVGLRVSSHPWCRALMESLGGALVSTSANFAGAPAPRSLMELDQRIAEQADLVIDGGTLAGIESTVLDLCVEPAVVRREGAIKAGEINRILTKYK